MTKQNKLIERFRTQPKDFTWDELVKLLKGFGFELESKGKTSGSRMIFRNNDFKDAIRIHKPHPLEILKSYQIKDILELLIDLRLIEK